MEMTRISLQTRPRLRRSGSAADSPALSLQTGGLLPNARRFETARPRTNSHYVLLWNREATGARRTRCDPARSGTGSERFNEISNNPCIASHEPSRLQAERRRSSQAGDSVRGPRGVRSEQNGIDTRCNALPQRRPTDGTHGAFSVSETFPLWTFPQDSYCAILRHGQAVIVIVRVQGWVLVKSGVPSLLFRGKNNLPRHG